MSSLALTVGTAGHIDHGKTALIEALTGRDTDRLAEEKRRGISIELGYAELELDGRRLSLVDVPGHERLVRTMIAGATGIDLFLMVVAADDGVMPQTREHLRVLEALAVERGVVVLTKCDAVDAAARAAAAAEAERLVPGRPLVEVSARTGAGLDRLREALATVAADTSPAAPEDDEPVLHVDRVFSLPGHGTVVTGTLWSGTIAAGDRVLILPQGIERRVRGVQSHDRPLERALSHRRVALNLAGVGRDELSRGDVITAPGSALRPSYRLDVELGAGLEGLESGVRVQVHHGTRESPARLVLLGPRAAQLRLEAPLIARAGDRAVIRQIAPPDTLGGATVVDPNPRRHGLETLESRPQPTQSVAPARSEKEVLQLDETCVRVLAVLRREATSPPGEEAIAEGLSSTRADTDRALRALALAGHAVEVKPGIWFAARSLDEIRERTLARARADGAITIAALRDELGTSRRYAQALLERFDSEKILLRQGDRHVPRQRAPSR